MTLAVFAIAGFAVAVVVAWRAFAGTLAALTADAWLSLGLGLALLVVPLAGLGLYASSLFDLPTNIAFVLAFASFVGWWIVVVALAKLAFRRRSAVVA